MSDSVVLSIGITLAVLVFLFATWSIWAYHRSKTHP